MAREGLRRKIRQAEASLRPGTLAALILVNDATTPARIKTEAKAMLSKAKDRLVREIRQTRIEDRTPVVALPKRIPQKPTGPEPPES